MIDVASTLSRARRRWLPEGTSLTRWDEIGPWYDRLWGRAVDSPAALERWLRDVDELDAAVRQEGNRRYIAMTCQTDHPARETAHLDFVRGVEPWLKVARHSLREKYLDSPHRVGLSTRGYRVFDRLQENRRALYRKENIARETELTELERRYQKVAGAMTVSFQGKVRTPEQMSPFLEETDRGLRQAAWERVAARRMADRERLDDLFDRMVTVRDELAREAGFSDFVSYAYRLRERFDYGVEQTTAFGEAVERVVVPVARRIQAERHAALGVDRLRPWDLVVDPHGRPRLRPFDCVEQLCDRAEAVFGRIDPEFGAQFRFLREHGLLDLSNRKGKAPGGYQTTLEGDRLPFIFMNAVGLDSDVGTLLHEGGHAFHTLAARGEALAAYREGPIEFCEVAAMAMELLGSGHLDEFYHPVDAARSYRQSLERTLLMLPWIAAVDAFQHWVYAHPGHDREQRRAVWTGLMRRFGDDVDWSGYEDPRASYWHRQLHIFLYPFYYVEYGIAQLGALGIWRRSQAEPARAVHDYRRALALGGSRPLPELFAAAGVPFAFDEATIVPLIEAVRAEHDRPGH